MIISCKQNCLQRKRKRHSRAKVASKEIIGVVIQQALETSLLLGTRDAALAGRNTGGTLAVVVVVKHAFLSDAGGHGLTAATTRATRHQL